MNGSRPQLKKPKNYAKSQIESSLTAKRYIISKHVSIDLSKGSEESRKRASEFVRGDDELFKVFTELAQRYKFREGGYTRILRSRIRANDSAKLAYIE